VICLCLWGCRIYENSEPNQYTTSSKRWKNQSDITSCSVKAAILFRTDINLYRRKPSCLVDIAILFSKEHHTVCVSVCLGVYGCVSVCLWVYVWVCVHMSVGVCLGVYGCVHMSVGVCLGVYGCVSICLWVYVWVCMGMCLYVCGCMSGCVWVCVYMSVGVCLGVYGCMSICLWVYLSNYAPRFQLLNKLIDFHESLYEGMQLEATQCRTF
jgi:hypothetical protein